MPYEPKHIKRWTKPDHYIGETWHDYYSSGFGLSRDSDVLERSNFTAALDALGGESQTVLVVEESHWAVGWVEWIAIHESDERALEIADQLREKVENYPVLDEHAYSELEWNEAAEYWDSMSPREKVRYAMDVRENYHWLKNEPVWFYGRMSFYDLANYDSTISEAIYQSLRE